jgi:phage terminase large subunit-like protein
MAEDARRMPNRESEFRNLVLNQRVEASSPFVKPRLWNSCNAPVAEFEGRECFGGLDLSEANDLTALCLICRISGIWHVRPTFWLPQEGIHERSRADRVPYDQWAQEGWLELTPGNSISYEVIARRLRHVFEHYSVRKIAFDRWNFRHLKPWLAQAGFSEQMISERWVEFGQGTQSMSPALRELESAILERELAHGDHPVLKMCAMNAVAEGHDSSVRKLSKKRSTGRIDTAWSRSQWRLAWRRSKRPSSTRRPLSDRTSALGVNRRCRDGENDVNDPERTSDIGPTVQGGDKKLCAFVLAVTIVAVHYRVGRKSIR